MRCFYSIHSHLIASLNLLLSPMINFSFVKLRYTGLERPDWLETIEQPITVLKIGKVFFT